MAVMALTDGGFWATRCSQHCQVRQEMDANTFSETSAQFHLLRCCRMWPLRPAQPLEASADIVRVFLVWYEEFEIYYIWDDVEMSLRWVWNGLIEMFVCECGVVGVMCLNFEFWIGHHRCCSLIKRVNYLFFCYSFWLGFSLIWVVFWQ